jgi:hypothetical protein
MYKRKKEKVFEGKNSTNKGAKRNSIFQHDLFFYFDQLFGIYYRNYHIFLAEVDIGLKLNQTKQLTNSE